MPRRVYIKPADFERHGFMEGCRGCTWLTNKLGPRVNHSDGCRARMEKIIGEDETDERTKKMKERFDHYAAQQVAEGDENRVSAENPRPDAPEDVSPPEPRDDGDGRRKEPEEFNIGSPMKENGIDEDMGADDNELDDGPVTVSERRVKSPTRAPATKPKKSIHAEEPDTKKSIIGDLTDDENDLDIDSLRAKQEDIHIVSMAILGRSIHESYSNSRIELAVSCQTAEAMINGLMNTDVTEIFSPERVAQVCREFGLKPGLSMNIKSGYDFDDKKDRDRCWEAIKRDKPSIVIGSPPCTLFSKLQELNKFMHKDNKTWML